MKEHELAVDINIQQAASLYAIASTIVGTGKVSHKKSLKQIVKTTRKAVLNAIGNDAGWAIMRANKEPIELYLQGIKKDKRLDKNQSRQMFQVAVDELTETCLKGSQKLF